MTTDNQTKISNYNANSAEAYDNIKPTLTDREQQVYDWICDMRQPNIEDVSEMMNKLPHQISGRFTALKKKGKIFVGGKKLNKGGYTTDWYIPR